MSSKRTVKGIAFDGRVADLVGHMESIGDYRESLQRLQDVWDQLTLLGETILPVHIAGMLLVFVGLLCIDGRIFKLWSRAPA